MPIKISMFTKINLIIIMLIIPVVALNGYIVQTSNSVILQEIEDARLSHLSLLSNEMDTNINQLSSYAVTLRQNDNTQEYINDPNLDPYSRVIVILNLESMLKLNSSSFSWQHDISVYAPEKGEYVTSYGVFSYDRDELNRNFTIRWKYQKLTGNSSSFVRHVINFPKSGYTAQNYKMIIQISFSTDNLVRMLDNYKKEGSGDPLLLEPQSQSYILNSSANNELSRELISKLKSDKLQYKGSRLLTLHDKMYMVNFHHSETLGWYLIDYSPVTDVLTPIRHSQNIFYSSVTLLITLAFIASYAFYRNVQRPIRDLTSNVNSIIRGNYSARLRNKSSNYEFQFLKDKFNQMAQQIQKLIETVYESQLRLNESKLKLLQSQIDPHFLYNSLFFIKNNAALGNESSVIAMALNLGEYYRYSTKLDKPLASLNEELNLIKNYLHIHNLRLNRIQFEIDFPGEMLELQIPRLLLQPIVENAIIHGIENQLYPGMIRIVGGSRDDMYMIAIEDNGAGMTDEQLADLNRRIGLPASIGTSYGLWNVRQRLILHFQSPADLVCEHSPSGGLRISLSWKKQILE